MATKTSTTKAAAVKPLFPLKGVRIVSLALNLPGPAALMRCQPVPSWSRAPTRQRP